jgi:hypothetical protein
MYALSTFSLVVPAETPSILPFKSLTLFMPESLRVASFVPVINVVGK